MRQIAKKIDKELGGLGFALVVYEFGKPGMSNYISNGNREDMIKALYETAERLNGKQDFPTHETN